MTAAPSEGEAYAEAVSSLLATHGLLAEGEEEAFKRFLRGW